MIKLLSVMLNDLISKSYYINSKYMFVYRTWILETEYMHCVAQGDVVKTVYTDKVSGHNI